MIGCGRCRSPNILTEADIQVYLDVLYGPVALTTQRKERRGTHPVGVFASEVHAGDHWHADLARDANTPHVPRTMGEIKDKFRPVRRTTPISSTWRAGLARFWPGQRA